MSTALGLAVLTGLVWMSAHPPLGVWWLILLVVPGWLTALAQVADQRARDAFVVGLTVALAAFLPMLWWLAAPATPIAPVLLALALAVYLGIASVVVQPWITRPAVAVVAPVVWAGFEVVRARWPFSGFGWGDLATAHVDGSWMLTSARVLGADGLTLLTALLGALAWVSVRGALAAWASGAGSEPAAPVPGAARVVHAFDAVRPTALGTLGVAVLGLLITVEPPPQVGTMDVLVVQGSDGVARARGVVEDLRILESHVAETAAAVEDGGVPDLTVWAENAVDSDPTTTTGAELAAPLAEAGALTEGRLLTGLTRAGPSSGTFRNQMVQIERDGGLGLAYDKIDIVPFGEYVPWRSVLGGFGPLDRVPRDAIAGTAPVTHEIAGVRIASIICFETLFPGTVRAAVADDDAGILVAATNNSSYGRSAQSAQHLAQSRLRAIETGRSVVHASISGASGLITPDGQVVAEAPLLEVASVRRTLPIVSGATPAATIAPVVSGAIGVAYGALVLLRVVGLLRERYSR